MNSTKHNRIAGHAVLEKFVTDAAARRFFVNPSQLTLKQKYEILTDYIRECIANAWKQSEWVQKPVRYFLSFEYSFGKQTLQAEYALQLTEELETLASIMDTTYEALQNCEETPQLGYGTLGRFGAAWMAKTSMEDDPWMGYGLRYRSGFYQHRIIDNRPVETTIGEGGTALNPWEIQTDVRYPVRFCNETVIATGIDYPIMSEGATRIDYVRLWDAEDNGYVNEAHFREGEYVKAYVQSLDARRLVEFLYPAESNEPGKKLRFMQEYFFASATAQDLLARYFASPETELRQVYINEIHPVFVIPEMIRLLIEEHEYTMEQAVDFVRGIFSYGNQILTEEAFETWSIELIEDTLPNMLVYLQQMDEYARQNSPVWKRQSQSVRGIIREERVHLSNIALYFCKDVYTFSNTHHQSFAKRVGVPETSADPFRIMPSIPPNTQLLKQYNAATYRYLETGRSDPSALAEIKLLRKQEFARELKDRHSVIVNDKSIYNVHIGNFHENNRQLLMVLHIAELHRQLLALPQLDIPETTYFFAGKAYPGYLMATQTVHLINAYSKWLSHDNLIHNKLKIVFMENMDVELERKLLYASDIFQPIRLPSQATVPINMNDALLHGSAVLASTHGYTKTIHDRLRAPGGLTLFDETIQDRTKGMDAMRFLLSHKQELGFDVSRMIAELDKYQDSFHIVGSFDDYHEKMLALTKSYFNEDMWNAARASNQVQMWKLSQESKGCLLCNGQ